MFRHILNYIWKGVQNALLHSGVVRDICRAQQKAEVVEFFPLNNPHSLKKFQNKEKAKKKQKKTWSVPTMNCTRASKKLSWVKGACASAWRFTGTPETLAKASSPSLPLNAMFCSWHASTHSCAWWLSRWVWRGPDAVDSAYGCTLMEWLFWWSFLWKLSAKYGGNKGKKKLTSKMCIALSHWWP